MFNEFMDQLGKPSLILTELVGHDTDRLQVYEMMLTEDAKLRSAMYWYPVQEKALLSQYLKATPDERKGDYWSNHNNITVLHIAAIYTCYRAALVAGIAREYIDCLDSPVSDSDAVLFGLINDAEQFIDATLIMSFPWRDRQFFPNLWFEPL